MEGCKHLTFTSGDVQSSTHNCIWSCCKGKLPCWDDLSCNSNLVASRVQFTESCHEEPGY
eukprot:3637709-Amphidinium_carterae.1